jgi:restriction system protein
MVRENEPGGPKCVRYFAPVIQALKDLGGSARPAEVCDQIAAALGISDEDQAELLPSGAQTRFRNQVGWARFYLVKAGIVDASLRGVWALTEKGRALRELSASDALDLFHSVHVQFISEPDTTAGAGLEDETEAPTDEGATTSGPTHRSQVIEALLSLSPSGFESFAQRLLRESGFQRVDVTGRSGDGGIDGSGILEVNPLVSFTVLFQCKRYAGSVGASTVRDFRGAMTGRTDKGIILTTGTFTNEARKEALRDGAPPIELIDGDKLVDMLEDLELGLKPVRAYRIDESFFDEFRSHVSKPPVPVVGL